MWPNPWRSGRLQVLSREISQSKLVSVSNIGIIPGRNPAAAAKAVRCSLLQIFIPRNPSERAKTLTSAAILKRTFRIIARTFADSRRDGVSRDAGCPEKLSRQADRRDRSRTGNGSSERLRSFRLLHKLRMEALRPQPSHVRAGPAEGTWVREWRRRDCSRQRRRDRRARRSRRKSRSRNGGTEVPGASRPGITESGVQRSDSAVRVCGLRHAGRSLAFPLALGRGVRNEASAQCSTLLERRKRA